MTVPEEVPGGSGRFPSHLRSCRRRTPVVLVAFLFACASAALLPSVSPTAEFRQEPIVGSWAEELGEKLYKLSQTVTMADEIEAKYYEMGATVEEKDPRKLLDQIVDRIDGMLQRKAEAVKCIVERVEELAERLHQNGGGKNNSSSSEEQEEEEGENQGHGGREVTPGDGARGRGRRDKGTPPESGKGGSGEGGEDGGGGEEEEDEDDGDEGDEDEVLIEFSYHSAKCSQVEVLIEDADATTNGSLYREDNSTCENDGIYRPMRLKADRHFYNIPVNDSHSAVHVPTNVYDQAPRLLRLISMSEGLDEVFVKNYQSDPSLSWQYFGSAAGYLRHFPAMRWKSDPDLFDCRGRPWYVEAASACTKSAVVLVDTTGSMTGMRYSIARLTTGALLETFAPNDLVSVVKFSETPEELVPCFKDMLVPATRENIIAFKQALADAQDHTEGYANFTAAFEKAFELFEINRASRSDCNQCGPIDNEVLFLVTDNVPGNWSWFLGQYNSLNSPLSMRRSANESYNNFTTMMDEEGPNVQPLMDKSYPDSMPAPVPSDPTEKDGEGMLPPVRIVAFLIGKEVFNIKEIEKFTCENRGFSVNLQSLDEVKEEVLEYVPLLAKPLALVSAERDYPRPIVWTHTFADVSEDDESLGYDYQEYRLMTSVSSPAFIRRTINTTNETDVVAELLGVAGTDVPIDEFLELLHLYEIGANGYGFAGTTEGNILFHPDLRPVFQGSLKDGFNSVDIAEIELIANGKGPREFSEDLLKLRDGMINQEKGEILEMNVLMHHDDMRRLTSEMRNYYYAPLPGTPYSVTLSLPSTYGLSKVEVKGEEEVGILKKKGLTEYFNDENWKVHSNWVYCKYLSEAFHLFQSQEERLLHFLERIQQPDWKWEKSDPLFIASDMSTHCRHAELAKDVHLCDKSLIELLLFDARLTNTFFRTKEWNLDVEEEKELFQIFNVTLRFIATHSGLTRWQQSPTQNENTTHKYFIENYNHATDESWYKLSVLQHELDPGSYVYTFPYPRGGEEETEEESDPVHHLTVSRAVFLREGNESAPASVVGYQFPQSSLQSLLEKITSDYFCANGDNSSICGHRKRILSNMQNPRNDTAENFLFSSLSIAPSCESGEVICYIIDGSGYILAVINTDNSTEDSNTQKNIGKFFGEVEPDVMTELVEVGMYSRQPFFDYQGLCMEKFITSRASFLLMPFYGLKWIFQWAIGQFVWIMLKTNIHSLIFPQWAEAAVDAYYDNYDDSGLLVPFGKEDDGEEEVVLKDWRGRSIEKDDDYQPKFITTTVYESCDKWAYRFSLTPPPPPPPTEAPNTTLAYNGTESFEDFNTTSNYSDTMASTTSITDTLIHQSVWNRWKRSAPTTTSSLPATDQTYNETQWSTTEDYENITRLNVSGDAGNETHCSRPYTAERIPHSDLVLVVITNSELYLSCMESIKEDDELDQESDSKKESEEYWDPSGSEMHVELKQLHYNDTHVCHKLRTGKLPRGKRINSCFTQHPKERFGLLTCRGCVMCMPNVLLMVLSCSFVILVNKKLHLVVS